MESAESAVTTESAPVIEAPVETAEVIEAPAGIVTESAPVEEEKPQADLGNKGLEELKTQRRRRQEAERQAQQQAAEAAYWRGQAEARGAKEPEVKQPRQQVSDPSQIIAPILDNFETYEAYERAKDEYLIQVAEARFTQRMRQQQQQQQNMTVQQKFDSELAKAVDVDPTIADAVEEVGAKISADFGMLIKQSDQPIEVVKWLHNNPKELARVAKLSPIMAAKELGAIEASLKLTPKPSAPKKVSAAPEPVNTVKSTSAAVIDEDSLPIDEWLKRRNKVAGYR